MTTYIIQDLETGANIAIVRGAANQAQAVRAYCADKIGARPASADEVIDLVDVVPVMSVKPAVEPINDARAA